MWAVSVPGTVAEPRREGTLALAVRRPGPESGCRHGPLSFWWRQWPLVCPGSSVPHRHAGPPSRVGLGLTLWLLVTVFK